MHTQYNYNGKHLDFSVDFLTATQDKYPYHELIGAVYPLDELDRAIEVAHTGAHPRVAVVPFNGQWQNAALN